jgi:ring-1,2-phenylacetyl-CoA epoxidase subunit PaaE
MATSDPIKLRIKKIIAETADTKSFVLEPLGGRQLYYEPGQFLSFVFQKSNGEEERRNYSISSIPEANEPLQVTVKRVPNGEYSRKLVDFAGEGDVLTTIGASGFFTLPARPALYDQFIFFAAGSGITPIFSLIQTILQKHPGIQVLLIYSNRSEADTIFYQRLIDLRKAYPEQFKIEFLFSNQTDVHHKRLGIYLLEKFLQQYVVAPVQKQLFYLCGPFEYMRMITIVLRNHGVPFQHIRKEIFVIEKPVMKLLPPDQEMHQVTVTVNNKVYVFNTQFPETILQTAKKLNIPFPYSCEAGQCGTCAATCVSGKVWMWRNDVLLDEEIANGRVLTCTGFVIDGDLVITYL